ncbi:MFS transporter [Nonomuraea dietziae]|uniref:MFS transporter n=1 Tax=Nonomuraea dietziae TaxID=65515 RepID=UPI0031D9E3A1
MLLPSLATSIANVGLPSMAVAFDAAFNEVQWVVIAYLLAITTLIVGVGRLGDLAGRRRLLLTGIAVFTLATLPVRSGPEPSSPGRRQGAPGSRCRVHDGADMAFVGETVPTDRTGSVMGLLGTMSAVGTALGPSLGGVLIAVFGWRAIFLVGVPLGLLALALALRVLPGPAPAAGLRTAAVRHCGYGVAGDHPGRLRAGHDDRRHSFGLLAIGLLVASGAGLALFVITERRVSSPLLTLSMFRDPVLAGGLTTSALVSAVMMATLVVGPFHLALALGLDPAFVGLAMSAGPAVSALTGVPAGRATDRLGAETMVVVGLCGIIGGTVVLALMPTAAGVIGYVLPLVAVTAGYALSRRPTTRRS